MKKLLLTSVMATGVLLTACASGTSVFKLKSAKSDTAQAQVTAPYKAQTVRYMCETGDEVIAKYTDDSTVELSIQGQTVVMKNAPAASGAYYVSDSGLFGYGGSWHAKKDMAVFEVKNTKNMPIQLNCEKK